MITGGFADERLLSRPFGHPLLHSEWRRDSPELRARLTPRNRKRQRRSADWQSAVSPVGNRRTCRLPVGEAAGCQPALRRGYWAGENPPDIARAWRPVTGGGSHVAQAGSLPCRRLATGGPADCQSATQQITNLRYSLVTGQGRGEEVPRQFLPIFFRTWHNSPILPSHSHHER
jgi:hypothetical protein